MQIPFQEESAGIRDEERHLQRIILRLFIKLTLIAPAKRSVITGIRKKDINDEYKKLSINGINVNIPCGLSRDLCAALKYAELKNGVPIKEKDNIFEYLYRYKGKFRVESLNTWFYNLAQDFGVMENECKDKKTLAVEPIKNMVIQMMVDNMINPVFISKIAGLTLSMIEATYYPKDWNVKYEEDINKCINKSDKTAQGAINQIKNKQYVSALKEYRGDILLVGINYEKKSRKHQCKIEKFITEI